MTGRGRVELSVSTWQQPMPPSPGGSRRCVVEHVADRVVALGGRRVRVAVDGRTGAGKTSFGHELAMALAAQDRVVLRASLDDFKRPWCESHRYDRVSGEGYFRNAFDDEAIRRLLLEPAAPSGSGAVVLCSIDPLTQLRHDDTVVAMPVDGVLIVDGVFALRTALDEHWDLRIWLDVSPEVSLRRGVARDQAMEGGHEAAASLHRERYQPAEEIYLAEVRPSLIADIVIDNHDLLRPVVLRTTPAASAQS